MTDFLEFLRATSYPGRGILVGRRCVYYFIMGRSENSRNRVFVKTEDGIRTEAHDPAKLSDPSLIIYHPVRTMGRDLVVTNGDQTDTICEHGDFRRGLMTREYEPDEPNWTPRISAIMHEDGSFELVFLGDGESNFHLELTWLRDKEGAYELGDNESHLCIRVAGDYDAVREYHRSRGWVCYENHDMGLYFINDPDDYWIEVLPVK